MTILLVVAKAPVPGKVKTRLAADIGNDAAAKVAAASLIATIDVCTTAFGPRQCRIALEGDLDDAVDGPLVRHALAGWTISPQTGSSLGERIAAAFAPLNGPVIQIGMDTPQTTARQLLDAAATLDHHDAVLAPAEDGGWWLLGLREPTDAAVIATVPMSSPRTGTLTRHALESAGLDVATAPKLRDIDTLDDLEAIRKSHPRIFRITERTPR